MLTYKDKTNEYVDPLKYHLKGDLVDQRVCLKCFGGMGDVLMAIGGTAYALSESGAIVTAAVASHHQDLVTRLVGVFDTVPISRLNTAEGRLQFDRLIDFEGVFANSRQLRAADYYKLVSERAGITVTPGKFERVSRTYTVNVALLHTCASNPNRRWPTDRWTDLAYELAASGYCVRFLGTKDEFGFTDSGAGIFKCSDYGATLHSQITELSVAKLFVGNDSGFAHIAGMLGTPGAVIFSTTHPDDVIAHYPSLRGVHAFDKLGIAPSRTLRGQDDDATKLMNAVTVEDVLAALNLNPSGVLWERCMTLPKRHKVLIVGVPSDVAKYAEWLKDSYELAFADNMPTQSADYDAVLLVTTSDGSPMLRHRSHGIEKTSRIATYNEEVVRRAFRELLNE